MDNKIVGTNVFVHNIYPPQWTKFGNKPRENYYYDSNIPPPETKLLKFGLIFRLLKDCIDLKDVSFSGYQIYYITLTLTNVKIDFAF